MKNKVANVKIVFYVCVLKGNFIFENNSKEKKSHTQIFVLVMCKRLGLHVKSFQDKVDRQKIKRKKCKCSVDCEKFPTMGCSGFFYAHLPPDLREKLGTRNKIAKRNRNKKTATSRKLHAAQREVDSDKIKQDLWYRIRRHEMTGFCSECGERSNKDNDEFYKWSIAHIVPKKLVPSVKLHPENWIELCRWHHDDYDHDFERASNMKCFAEAKRKYNLFCEFIDADELRFVNPFLKN